MTDYRSLFIDQPQRQWASGPGASGEWRIKPTSLLDDEQDDRFPAFQNAWKQGAALTDLFGPNPFDLHGTVAPSGGDNHRPDVAKVQTLLGKAGYLDLGADGPSGYPTDQADDAIRRFQKDKGLAIDGILKPGGPTITALGGLLGGGSAPAPKPAQPKGLFGEFNDTAGTDKPAGIVPGEWDWEDEERRKRMPNWPGTPPLIPRPGGDLDDILSGPWPKPEPQPSLNPLPPLGGPNDIRPHSPACPSLRFPAISRATCRWSASRRPRSSNSGPRRSRSPSTRRPTANGSRRTGRPSSAMRN